MAETRREDDLGFRIGLSPGKVHLFVASPREGQVIRRTALVVEGVCLVPGETVDRIDILLDGAFIGRARIGVESLHEAAQSPDPAALFCRFEKILDLSNLPSRKLQVAVSGIALTTKMRQYRIPPVQVTLAPPEMRGPDTPAPAAVTAPTGKRIACVTHDLNLGGGQLYLHEVIRRSPQFAPIAWTVAAPRGGDLEVELQRLGASVHLTGEFPLDNYRLYTDRLEELAAWLRVRRIDAVLANTLGAFPAVHAASIAGIPCVWAIHESYTLHSWFAAAGLGDAPVEVISSARAALAQATAVVFEAEATLRLFRAESPDANLLKVPYGIDISEIAAFRAKNSKDTSRKSVKISGDKTLLLCMATTSARKGQALLIHAFATVVENARDDLHLALVGAVPGQYVEALQMQVRRLGLETRVTISAPDPDPYSWYAAADLLVLPSDIESLPRTVLEAMAFALPVAATDVWGVSEVLRDGESALLMEPNSISSIEGALRRFLGLGPAGRQEMAERAAKIVASHHDSAGYTGRLLSLLGVTASAKD